MSFIGYGLDHEFLEVSPEPVDTLPKDPLTIGGRPFIAIRASGSVHDCPEEVIR
jgi:hypothetical protein